MLKIAVHQSDCRGNVFTLLEPIRYMGLEIPAGFESDGASVPRFFWRLVFPPGESKALFAAFVHDFLYRTHPARWLRKQADQLFRTLLIADGIPAWQAQLAYWGLRLCGQKAWRRGVEQ